MNRVNWSRGRWLSERFKERESIGGVIGMSEGWVSRRVSGMKILVLPGRTVLKKQGRLREIRLVLSVFILSRKFYIKRADRRKIGGS